MRRSILKIDRSNAMHSQDFFFDHSDSSKRMLNKSQTFFIASRFFSAGIFSMAYLSAVLGITARRSRMN